ncbi:amidohydrolase [Enterocloster asparagiformis]|uniref:M20 metallopeptidase family protein n=1 Tax=Enterocloster asparagiformis TaxID=333367 RepID=UPI0034C3963D
MTFQQFKDKYQDYLVTVRRRFHESPELSMEEKETSRFIVAEVEACGLPYEMAGDYGVIAVVQGTKPGMGRNVLLRADIDALPIQEDANNLAGPKNSCSKVPGVGHLCGHDAHTAMMLAVMKELTAIRDQFSGKFIICFEPAEENGKGCWLMLPYLEHYEIDRVYACHVEEGLDTGTVSIVPGSRMAGVGAFEYTIYGEGTHGAAPHRGVDPILCTAEMITGLNQILTRNIPPLSPMALTIGHVESGTARNAIPSQASFGGTMRFFDRGLGEFAYGRMKEIVNAIAAAHRCKVEQTFEYLSYPLVNDPHLADLACQAVGEALGTKAVVETEPKTGSEGFTNYIRAYHGQGLHVLIGVRNREYGSGEAAHNPKFDVDEAALPYGAFTTLQIALKLNECE